MDYLAKTLSMYEILPFGEHPLWQAVIRNELTLDQILRAEQQHYLRTKAGQDLRANSALNAPPTSPGVFEAALGNYLEEVAPYGSRPSHLDLIRRLLVLGGIPELNLDRAAATPGNAAAMALYRDIAARGSACHLIGAGAVEHFYSKLAPKIYDAYISHYGMTTDQAETYRIHGPMDKQHAERALSVLDEAIEVHGWSVIESSVRDAFVATSLHYDGMLQAASGRISYWNGEVE